MAQFTPNWYDTAHQQVKQKYPKYMFISSLAAIVLTGLGMVFSPPYVASPYQLRQRKMLVVNVQTDIFVPPPPKEISAPEMPMQDIEATDDADAAETIMDTDFNPFQPPSIPTATATSPDDFVAFDSPPRLVHAEQPEYPDLARQAEAEGTVMIEVTIDENGRVIAARVFSSDTIEALESAALAAALKFLFEPAKQRDVPVKCRIHIPFGFGLGG